MSGPLVFQCLSECFKEVEVFGIQNGDLNDMEDEEMEEPDVNPQMDPFDDGLPPINNEPSPPTQSEIPLFEGDNGHVDKDGMEVDCLCYDEDGNIIPMEEEDEPIDERPVVVIDYTPEDDEPDENIDIGEENPNKGGGELIGEDDVDIHETPPLDDPSEPPGDPIVEPPPLIPIFPKSPLDIM